MEPASEVFVRHVFMLAKRMIKPVEKGDGQQIVFFDGVCGLCNKTVDMLLSVSAGHSLKFAPLQGETAQRMLSSSQTKNLDSIVYWRAGTIWTKSTAVLMVLRDVGGLPALGVVFFVVPRPIRDFIYGIIAANRYSWFGKSDVCRMPSQEERERFFS